MKRLLLIRYLERVQRCEPVRVGTMEHFFSRRHTEQAQACGYVTLSENAARGWVTLTDEGAQHLAAVRQRARREAALPEIMGALEAARSALRDLDGRGKYAELRAELGRLLDL